MKFIVNPQTYAAIMQLAAECSASQSPLRFARQQWIDGLKDLVSCVGLSIEIDRCIELGEPIEIIVNANPNQDSYTI